MKKNNVRIVSILLIVALMAINTQAWGPIAHYSIGRDLGYGSKSGNMNLPDAWENIKWNYNIHDWFTWSHAVQRTGRNWYGVPNVPRYVDDGREPGRIMHVLAKDKIKWSNNSEKRKALETATGFVGHNAMDRPVHWNYFLGGESLDNWTIHHRDKEEWADYVIADLKGNITFDHRGKIQMLYGFNVQKAAFFLTASGCLKVIQIAQKVARKNRRRMDFENGEEKNAWTRVNSIKNIEKLIANMNKDIEKHVKKMTLERYDELEEMAEKHGWDRNDVERLYEQSFVTAQRWINALP